MEDDRPAQPLSRRVPGASDRDRLRAEAPYSPPVLPTAVLERMQAAVAAAKAEAAAQAQAEPSVTPADQPQPPPAAGDGGQPSTRQRLRRSDRPKQPSARRARPPSPAPAAAGGPDDVTQPISLTLAPPVTPVTPEPIWETPAAAGGSNLAPENDRASAPAAALDRAARLDQATALAKAGAPRETAEQRKGAGPSGTALQPESGEQPEAALAPPAKELDRTKVPDRTRRARPRRWTAVGAALALAATAGSLALILSRHGTTSAGDGSQASGRKAAAAALATRAQVAAWAATQISPAAMVSCDPVMCAALRQDGMSGRRLLQLRLGTANLLLSDVVIATPAVREQFGLRLGTVYAPVVLASFGPHSAQVDVRVIATQGPAAFRAALSADLSARRANGKTLLGTSQIQVSDGAREALSAGLVDSRLMLAIAAIAGRQPIYVQEFGDSGPGVSPGAPLRSVTLSPAPGQHKQSGAVFLRSTRAALAKVPPLYRPAWVKGVQPTGGTVAVQIEFTAPSPLGVLGPGH